jgi:RNA recognition motif-containing protein
MKLYVGNLAYSCTEDRLREIFEEHGEVASAALVMDRETGRPRGFGFVEFSDDNNARAAIEALNGQNIDGRDLTVNEAKPRENRGGGGGGGRGGYGGGGAAGKTPSPSSLIKPGSAGLFLVHAATPGSVSTPARRTLHPAASPRYTPTPTPARGAVSVQSRTGTHQGIGS